MKKLIALLVLLALSAHADSSFVGAGVSGWTPPPAQQQASTCTDGVDCYCDTASGANLILCEDFEADALYLGGAGNWAATDGNALNRSAGSYWSTTYGVYQGGSWCSPSPSSPRPSGSASCGQACSGGNGGGCGSKYGDYCSADQGNLIDGLGADCFNVNASACVDIQRGGDPFYEIPSVTLVNGKGSSAAIGAGNAHLAERLPAGNGNTCGFYGGKSLGSARTTVSVTFAFAWSSNILDAVGPYSTYFKSYQFQGNGPSDQPFQGMIGRGDATLIPFRAFMWAPSQQSCYEARANATVHVGYPGGPTTGDLGLRCDGDANIGEMYYAADPNVYQQADDLIPGRWYCEQASIDGLGTSNLTIKLWHDGTLIFHASGIDGTKLSNQYYNLFNWDSYQNANAGQGPPATTHTSWRYYDNWTMTNSATPRSCASIGY